MRMFTEPESWLGLRSAAAVEGKLAQRPAPSRDRPDAAGTAPGGLGAVFRRVLLVLRRR